MEILGVGAPELVFIVLIALIVLGPKDMQKAGKTLGRWLNQLVHSESWQVFQKTSRELRNLPTNLMREANMEVMRTEEAMRRAAGPKLPGTATPEHLPRPQPSPPAQTIQPPEDASAGKEPDA